jgi:hypothetical protein
MPAIAASPESNSTIPFTEPVTSKRSSLQMNLPAKS